MRSTNFMRHRERDAGAAIEAASDPAAARDGAADDAADFDQSLPVPWEWWPESRAAG